MAKINALCDSFFYPSYNGDRLYSDEDFGLPFRLCFENGVFLHRTALALQVTPGENMDLVLQPGYCFIEGHFAKVLAEGRITLDNADGAYPRIDRIVMRHYGAGGELDERKLAPFVLTGIPSSRPKAPDLVRDGTYYDLSLATVYVAAGATSIPGSAVTDTRLDPLVCGMVTRAREDPLDTAGLYARLQSGIQEDLERSQRQYAAFLEFLQDLKEAGRDGFSSLSDWFQGFRDQGTQAFQDWFQEVRDTLDQSACGNLLNQIQPLEQRSPVREIASIRHNLRRYPLACLYEARGAAGVEGFDTGGADGGPLKTIPAEFVMEDMDSLRVLTLPKFSREAEIIPFPSTHTQYHFAFQGMPESLILMLR